MGYQLYGVIGDAAVLGALRHPTMHPMQPLRRGLGLCAVRTAVAKDEAPSRLASHLVYLTDPVLGYVEELSDRAEVIYAVAVFFDGEGDQAACGWSQRQLAFGPCSSHHRTRPQAHVLRRRQPAAINDALAWLHVPRPLRGDRFAAVGLAELRAWEP
jgi:hypothetical protein